MPLAPILEQIIQIPRATSYDPTFILAGQLSAGGIGSTQGVPITDLIPTGLSSSNAVYVSVNGVDAPTSGSILSPYATLSYAQSQIITASPTNIFTIYVLDGQINDSGQIYANPYVNISGVGQQALVNNSMDVLIETGAWSSYSTPYCYISNVGFTNNFTFDFTGVSGPTLCSIFCTNTTVLGTYFADGGGSLGGQLFLRNVASYISTFTPSGCTINSQSNFYQTSVVVGGSSQSASTTAYFFSDEIIAFEADSSLFFGFDTNVSIQSSDLRSPVMSSGAHTTISMDASSIGIGLPQPNVTLVDQDTSIASSYSAINFTPTSADVRGMIQGIDNALGSEVPTLTNNYIGFGSTLNKLTGAADFTWNDSTKVQNLNSIITLNASPINPYLSIGSSGLSGPLFGESTSSGHFFSNDANFDTCIKNINGNILIGIGSGVSQVKLSTGGGVSIGNSAGVQTMVFGPTNTIQIPTFTTPGYLHNDASGNITSVPAATAPLTATYVGYGNASNDLTGTPDFTWTDSSKSLNLNSLITLNSTSVLPYITIGPNGGSGPTIGRVATAGQFFIDDAIGDFGIRNYSDGRILLGTGAVNANLILGASGAINIPAFNVAGYLTNDGSGNITSTPSANAALTATQIGFGNGSNVMGGASDFTWNDSSKVLSMNTSVEGVRITATDTNPFISIGSNARTCLATSGGAFFTDSVSGDMIIVNSSNILLGSNNFGHSSLKLNGTNQGIEVSTGGILFDNAGSGYVATALNNYAVGSASLVPVTGPWSGNITFWWTINGNTVTLSWAGVTATATANASLTTGNGVIPSYACPVGTKIHQVMGVNGVSSGSFTTICVQVTPAGSIDFSNANAGNFVIGQVVGTAYSEITYNIGPN